MRDTEQFEGSHLSCEPRDGCLGQQTLKCSKETSSPSAHTSPSRFLAGGMKEIALHTNRQYMRGLVGCISHFTLSTDYHIALVEDAVDGKNINTCGAK